MDNRRRYKNGRRKAPAYIPQGDPQALATPVEELGLHERTLGALKTGGVNTAGDIAARYMRDMYKVQGIGKRDIFAMQGALMGAASVWMCLTAVALNLVYTVALVALIARLLSSERIMFGT